MYIISILNFHVGILSIYHLCEGQREINLKLLSTIHIDPSILVEDCNSDILALSLDWNSRRNTLSKALEIAVSNSKGSVSTFSITDSLIEKTWNKEKCHEYEAWITAFNAWDPNVIFTGGDDGLLKIFDRRSEYRYVINIQSLYISSLNKTANCYF